MMEMMKTTRIMRTIIDRHDVDADFDFDVDEMNPMMKEME
jgi:hypothetical protein